MFHKLDWDNLNISDANVQLEKLTWKFCSLLLSNEHVEMTILLAFFSLKANGNIVTDYLDYDCNRNVHNIQITQYSKRAIND